MILSAVFPTYLRGSLEDGADRLKEIGYEGVGFTSDPRYGFYLLAAKEDTIEYMRNVFHSKNLKIGQIYHGANLISPNEKIRSKSINAVKKVIKIAEQLHCPCVAGSVGSLVHDYYARAFHPNNLSEKGWKLTIKSINHVLEAAEDAKVNFCVQPAMYSSVNSLEITKELMNVIDHPNLKVCLDPVNFIMGSTELYYNNASFLNEMFETLGEYIYTAHAKDLILDYEERGSFTALVFRETVAGEGNMDYLTFLKRLKELDSEICLLVEHLGSDEQYVKAYANISSLMRKLNTKNGSF